MAQPTSYNRQFNFSDQQAQTPTAPLPGDEVDNELNAVKVTLDQTLVNLAKIQRDDGALKNGIVTQDSLADSLSIGFTFRGTWTTATNYLESDGVSVGSIFYKAKSSHLSSGANQPPNATFWDQVADFTPLAIGADSVGTVALQDGAVTEPKIGSLAVTTSKIAVAAVTNPKLADMATATIKGRVTAGAGAPEDLTPAQARTVMELATVADTGDAADLIGTLSAARFPAGAVVNSVSSVFSTGGVGYSTAIPLDNTLPQITEGTEIQTAALTASNSANKIRIRWSGEVSTNSTPGSVIAALFKDSDANALAANFVTIATANYGAPLVLETEFAAGDTSAHTYRIRVGPDSGIASVNGNAAALLGGAARCTLVVEEIKA